MDRRLFILAFLSLGLASAMPTSSAWAKDGGDDGDSDDGGGGDSGGSGGSGSDDDDDDDSGKDDDKDDKDDKEDRSGSGRGSDDDNRDDDDDRSGSSRRERDQKEAREAVRRGEILPLREILKRLDEQGGGRVIAVDLNMQARKPFYTLKVQSGSSVRTLKFEAATGRKLNIFGW
ncbi:PepSY domain-containing protein [Rhizobium sp. R86522]|uniref:PepSY domain-containing protein n=1 Tax=Rhizobium sp. R86522 TaxID=3093861 RepID=UPI00366EE39A